jgi:hypothetical protein
MARPLHISYPGVIYQRGVDGLSSPHIPMRRYFLMRSKGNPSPEAVLLTEEQKTTILRAIIGWDGASIGS